MGIFSGFSSSQKKNLVVVFDIRSSSVGGALFDMQESGVPKIVFSIRETIERKNKHNASHLLSQMIKTLNSVAGQIATSRFGAPQKIFCVLSSPWYISQNRVIKMEKNSPFIFTDKLANNLIKKEIKLFKEDHINKYIESGHKVRVIELKNIKTILNGYEVINPLLQKAKELEMTLFLAVSGEDTLLKIEKVIDRHFHTTSIIFSTFLIASFTVVRDMHENQANFLLIDIDGEITDITMIKENLLRESVSYPIGTNSIIRSLASFLGCSFDEAKSSFSLYKDGHAEEKMKQKIEPAIGEVKNDWLKKFQSSLANLSHDISVPANIFITTDKTFASFFIELIKSEQFNQYTLTQSKFELTLLSPEVLHKIATFENNTIRDVLLLINTVYISRFLSKHNNV